MIFISILMMLWRLFVQKCRKMLQTLSLPYGAPPPSKLEILLGDPPGRDDGSLYIVWFNSLGEMMLTCILVYATVWIFCQTPFIDSVPFLIGYGHSEGFHLPTTGNQYRKLFIDCSSIYFFSLLFYFMVMFPVARDAKSLTHKLTKGFGATPRGDEERGWPESSQQLLKSIKHSRTLASGAVMGSLARSQSNFEKDREWFASCMDDEIASRSEPEAAELKQTLGHDWNSFPLPQYLIMQLHLDMTSLFAFSWTLWLPVVVCFACFAFLHFAYHLGYIRIMMCFSVLALAITISIGWWIKSISMFMHEGKEEVEHEYKNSIHTKYKTDRWVIQALKFSLFFLFYGVARMVCQPWMWELHYWPVLFLTIFAIIIAIVFVTLVAPALPSFCAVMALPPYVNPENLKVMVYTVHCEAEGKI